MKRGSKHIGLRPNVFLLPDTQSPRAFRLDTEAGTARAFLSATEATSPRWSWARMETTGVSAMSNRPLLRAAMTSLVALGAASTAMSALAADEKQEQCAGVIKAGKNDCATSANACHGHVTTDSHPESWIYLPAGTCERIVGARVVKVVDPTPKGKKST